jgi:hypothetical protein
LQNFRCLSGFVAYEAVNIYFPLFHSLVPTYVLFNKSAVLHSPNCVNYKSVVDIWHWEFAARLMCSKTNVLICLKHHGLFFLNLTQLVFYHVRETFCVYLLLLVLNGKHD